MVIYGVRDDCITPSESGRKLKAELISTICTKYLQGQCFVRKLSEFGKSYRGRSAARIVRLGNKC